MASHGLDASNYVDGAIWAAEREDLFPRQWQFVGFRHTLALHNDWLTATVAGRSVVLQNFEGALKAYRNVCSHRNAQIRPDGSGNGMLRCPYHGWTYNAEGIPTGIPKNAECFGLDPAARRQLALPSLSVDTCGDLVFVRLSAEGPTLAEFLADYGEILADASTRLRSSFCEGQATWRCNWKIGIESAIEGYHLATVHPDSFNGLVDEVLPSEWNGPHSLGPSKLSAAAANSLERIQQRLGLDRLAASDRYEHYLIFPNVCITVTAGLTLSVQIYEPLGPQETRLRYWLATGASSKPQHRDSPVRRAILGSMISFNEQVLLEDQAISERVQAGRSAWPLPPAVLGRNEDRLIAFHRAWHDAMTAGRGL